MSNHLNWTLQKLTLMASQLIPYYAQYEASQPAMWGGASPSTKQVETLTKSFVAEWNWAIEQLLCHWDQPPCR